MHIKYEEPTHRPPNTFTFSELMPGRWYEGCQTGRLYFYYESSDGKPRLLRCDDNQDCTSRFQRGGTFRPVEVTVTVMRPVPELPPVSTYGVPYPPCSGSEFRRNVENRLRELSILGRWDSNDNHVLVIPPAFKKKLRRRQQGKMVSGPGGLRHLADMTVDLDDGLVVPFRWGGLDDRSSCA